MSDIAKDPQDWRIYVLDNDRGDRGEDLHGTMHEARAVASRLSAAVRSGMVSLRLIQGRREQEVMRYHGGHEDTERIGDGTYDTGHRGPSFGEMLDAV